MKTMEPTLGWKGAHPFGPVPELLLNTFVGKRHAKLHHPKLWLSYMALCRRQCGVSFNGVDGMLLQKRGASVDLVVSSLKEDTLLMLPACVEQASFKMAEDIAYKSLSREPFVGPLMEPISSKSHPSKRRLFPASEPLMVNDGGNALFSANPSSPAADGNHALDYSDGPSSAVVMCLECLELTGSHLGKCLKHARSVAEEDLVGLLKTLSTYGFQRSNIRAMFSKYPSLVKVQGIQASHCFQYFSSLGFSKNVVASLLLKRPALLACDLKRASRVIEYFLAIGTSNEDLISMISCRPHVVEHDVEVIKIIMNALLRANLDQSDIKKLIKRAPTVFTGSLQDIDRSLLFWAKVGVQGKSLCRAILRRPNLLNYNTENMLKTYRYLQQWFEPHNLTKLLSRFAELLAYDPEVKLKPLIGYFSELGLSEEEIARAILRRPQLMSCTSERLRRVADFLIGLGLKDYMIGKVLIASPQVFTLNVEDKLKRGVEFFRSVGLDKERDIEFVFSRSAQLFCCSIERNLLPTFEFLSNIGLGKENLSTMIATFPSMMGQSVELSLAPKYEFLIEEMKRTKQELVEFPQYFGYSLERRIKPRHKLLAERGLYKSLPSMLACTDRDFQKRYVEPYSPLSQPPSCNMENARKLLHPKVGKPKKKPVLTAVCKVQSKPMQQNQLPSPSEQDTLSRKNRPEVLIEESPMHNEWDFLDHIPRTHGRKGNLYPASFRKLYKNPTPLGIWIHAYKFDM